MKENISKLFMKFISVMSGNVENDIELKFEHEHQVGFCKVPNNLDSIPLLKASSRKFIAPVTVDLRDYCTKTEDQGNKPWCAAYTAAQWAENILWRVNDYPENIDPTWIYEYAKSVDGDPHGDGTTLVAVLEALLNKGTFDKSICKIKVINRGENARQSVKYAIHKFGCILGAFNITKEWYSLCNRDTAVTGKRNNVSMGGHAVLICGYNADGVIIQNSWGESWGEYGFGLVTWEAFDKQFLYASVLSNSLNGMTIND